MIMRESLRERARGLRAPHADADVGLVGTAGGKQMARKRTSARARARVTLRITLRASASLFLALLFRTPPRNTQSTRNILHDSSWAPFDVVRAFYIYPYTDVFATCI